MCSNSLPAPAKSSICWGNNSIPSAVAASYTSPSVRYPASFTSLSKSFCSFGWSIPIAINCCCAVFAIPAKSAFSPRAAISASAIISLTFGLAFLTAFATILPPTIVPPVGPPIRAPNKAPAVIFPLASLSVSPRLYSWCSKSAATTPSSTPSPKPSLNIASVTSPTPSPISPK